MRREISAVLKRLAFAYEVTGRQGGRSYGAAAWSIRSLREDVGELHASGRLAAVRGVGPRVMEVVGEVLAGQTPAVLAELEAEIPEGLYTVGRVPGLGPKKVRVLWQELGITTLGELEYACTENRLLSLKGFGAKTQAKVLQGIAQVRSYEGLCRLDQATEVAAELLAELDGCVCGPLRRGCELVDGVDVLLRSAAEVPDEVSGVPVRVHVCADPQRWGAALAHHTGTKGHLHTLAQRATSLGLTLDETGLHDAEGAPLPCPDEATLYHTLGVHLPTPERREDDVSLVLRTEPGPRLVRRGDLVGALHNHTTASDGLNTLEEMREAAAEQGLCYLGVSDHSQSAFYAKGLAAEALAEQGDAIARLNADGHPCHLLTGVESDILADGALDYPDEVLATLEVVVASLHSRHGQRGAEMTHRMTTAAANPWTDIVGHPTGRLLLGRAPAEYDIEAMLDACLRSGAAVELNASPARLDLDETHLAMARERGLKVSIAADAHNVEQLALLDYGVLIARRAGLRPTDVLNCLPLEALQGWLSARRDAIST